MTNAGRAARERIRLQAVGRFEGGDKNREIATALRVSERSVERWRRQWRERGEAGVLSKGSPGRPRLGEQQIVRLERELERGPLVHGWAHQRWTLARVKRPIGRLFHVSYTVEGTWRLLKRHGRSWQQPIRRAIERDDAALELWKKEVWHLTKPLRKFIDANATWLTVFQLPTYAPELNPQDGIWSLVKRDVGNLAAADLGEITRVVKRRLKQIPYRPDLVDGCLTGTGLIMDG
ncbi:winged helix-turn-helix domain-containing protein [Streptomyces sp. NBC_01615]|uniref:winged helix-turn-helix domain-containing protein n=1 Tax=Streptomyces sp. NBC_01615 TaxID=2975898 RepID=UPI00386D9D22